MDSCVVTARVWVDGSERILEVSGQAALALVALVEAGDSGCCALDGSIWAFRFASHCEVLRHRYGISTRSVHEEHAGGCIRRHILESAIEILGTEKSAEA